MKHLPFLFLLVAGCMTFPEASITGPKLDPKPSDHPISLTTGSDVGQLFTEVGMINVRASAAANTDQLNDALKRKAREIGADAVIRIQYGHEGMWGNPTASGTAVAFK